MINYGSGGIGSEIIANRLGVGPMHDCLNCTYEEFFLTSFTVGDPALLVDIPANVGLETLLPGAAAATRPRQGPEGEQGARTRTTRSTCTTATSATSSSSATRTSARNSTSSTCTTTSGCTTRTTTTRTTSTRRASAPASATPTRSTSAAPATATRAPATRSSTATSIRTSRRACGTTAQLRRVRGRHAARRSSGAGLSTRQPWALKNGTPAAGARALPDGEIVAGVPMVAIVPLPGKALRADAGRRWKSSRTRLDASEPAERSAAVAEVDSVGIGHRPASKNPGFPFWIAGIDDGRRPASARRR